MNNTTIVDPLTTAYQQQCVAGVDRYEEVKLFNCILTLCVSVFGLISNTLVILVYRKTRNLSSTDVYLTSLAISDNILIITLNLYAYRYAYAIVFPSIKDWILGGVVTLVGLLLMSIAQFVNTYIIVLLSLDRYVQVKRISISKTWCTSKRARVLLVVNIVAGVVFCLPRMWEYVPLIVHSSQSVQCWGYFKFSVHSIGSVPEFRLIYGFVLYTLFMYFIPLTLLTFTSSALICVIFKRTRWLRKIQAESSRGNKSGLKKSDANAILTLIVLTLVFIFFQIPDIALQFIWRLSPEYGPTASIFTYELIILNSSLNFIIYAVGSTPFRNRLTKVLKCTTTRDPATINNTMLGGNSGGSRSVNLHQPSVIHLSVHRAQL